MIQRPSLPGALLLAALLSTASCASSGSDAERGEPATITITLAIEDGSAEDVATKLNAILDALRRTSETDDLDLAAAARKSARFETDGPRSVVLHTESLEGAELQALLDLFERVSGRGETHGVPMDFDLAAALPLLAPKAVAWAEQRQTEILATGRALGGDELRVARSVGVAQPERVRIAFVERVPLPDDPELRRAAIATGLIGPDVAGMTLGHGVYVCGGSVDRRLLAHELRHVAQYERAGSIAAFLPEYLRQIATHGYEDAPYEVDARAHE